MVYEVVREVEIGLWFLVVGYYFLLFVYFILMRFRKTKNPFHFALGLFFFGVALGRAFLFVGDFYAGQEIQITGAPFTMPETDFFWRTGTFFQWMALAVLFSTAGYLILAEKWAQYGFAIPPIAIAVVYLVVPSGPLFDEMITFLNVVLAPLFAILIPLLFFYMAWRSAGILRRTNFLLGLGFLIFYAGRTMHSTAVRMIIGNLLGGVLSPVLIFFGLIFIVVGSQFELAK